MLTQTLLASLHDGLSGLFAILYSFASFYVHLIAQRLDKITEEMLDIGAVSGVADSYGE